MSLPPPPGHPLIPFLLEAGIIECRKPTFWERNDRIIILLAAVLLMLYFIGWAVMGFWQMTAVSLRWLSTIPPSVVLHYSALGAGAFLFLLVPFVILGIPPC